MRRWIAMAGSMAMLAAGSAGAQESQVIPEVLSSPKGCFVFGQISSIREDQFLLDTCTGRLWHILTSHEDRFLAPVPFAKLTELEKPNISIMNLPTTPPELEKPNSSIMNLPTTSP